MKSLKLFLLCFPFMAIGQTQFEAIREKIKRDNNYEYVYAFENGYAVFRTFNSKMGIIDSTGNIVIKPIFNYIHNNKELKNLFEVGNKNNNGFKRGFIDLQGSIKVPIIYEDVFYLERGLIRVGNQNKRGIIDSANNVILPLRFDDIIMDNTMLIAKEKGFYQLYDLKGMQISSSTFTDVSYSRNNKAIASTENATFIIDNKGKTIVAPINNHTFERILANDFYIIHENQTLKKGIVHASGKFQINCKYDEIQPSSSVFIVEQHAKKGIVTFSDNLLKPIIYDNIFSYEDDEAVSIAAPNLGTNYIALKDKLYGVINPFVASDVLPFNYQTIAPFMETYYLATNTKNKSGVFYKDGFKITEEEYEFYNRFNTVVFATKNGKPILIRLKDATFTESELPVDALVQHSQAEFEAVHPNQICKVLDKFGVVDSNGVMLIPCEYQKIENIYHSNEFVARKNNKFGVLNDRNEIIIPFEYDDFKILKEQILFTKNKKTIKKYHPIRFRYHAS